MTRRLKPRDNGLAARKETMKTRILTSFLLVLGGAAGCGGSGGAPVPSERVAAANDALTLGSQGDAVRAVTQSLAAYGYFPNAELARDFPAWRPVVPLAPADVSTYDDSTAQAVLEFQARNGLPPTGVADQATRTLLQQPRCGHPDGARFDPTDKFARAIDLSPTNCNKWNVSVVNLYVAAAPPGIALKDAQAAATAAAFTWNQAANELLTTKGPLPGTIFIKVSNSPTSGGIVIDPTTINGTSSTADAVTFTHCDSSGNMTSAVINTNNRQTFSVANPTPAGAADLQSVLLHELGHALGLEHSPDTNAAMNPFQPVPPAQRRATDDDDSWGLGSLYAKVQHSNSWPVAVDIGASHQGSGSRFPWMIDGNGAIYQYNGIGWVLDTTGANAMAISVGGQSEPFIVDFGGNVWFKPSANATSGTWLETAAPGAFDIGVGGDGGFVWILAEPLLPNGSDATVYQLTSGGWVADAAGAAGIGIAVNDQGVPFITNLAGEIWRKPSHDATSGAWDRIGVPIGTTRAFDVGVSNSSTPGLDNYAWVTSSDGNVYMFQEQAATGGLSPQQALRKWDVAPFSVPTGAFTLDVQGAGYAWIVANDGKIYEVVP